MMHSEITDAYLLLMQTIPLDFPQKEQLSFQPVSVSIWDSSARGWVSLGFVAYDIIVDIFEV